MTDSTADHYATLQVDPRADPDVIRAAYRTLARKYHPDVGEGSHEQMTALNNAWAVLRDPAARAAYDRERAARATPRVPSAPTAPFDPSASSAPPHGPAWGAKAQPPSMPPANTSGTVLDFGRYAGWSLSELARHDPDFLEWLARTPAGRHYRAEIQRLLASPGRAAHVVPARKPGWARFG